MNKNMEKLDLEYSRRNEFEERWTDPKTKRLVKKKVEYPGFTEEYFYDDLGWQHSHNDAPAVICTYDKTGDRTYTWKFHGCLHRENGPAVIDPFNGEEWRQKGKLYRPDDLPTIVHYGNLEIWRDGNDRLFTTPNRLYVARKNGVNGYLEEGRIAFTDGSVIRLDEKERFHANASGNEPAIVWADGTKEWYEHGYMMYYPSK
jgi:hypothetical protein